MNEKYGFPHGIQITAGIANHKPQLGLGTSLRCGHVRMERGGEWKKQYFETTLKL